MSLALLDAAVSLGGVEVLCAAEVTEGFTSVSGDGVGLGSKKVVGCSFAETITGLLVAGRVSAGTGVDVSGIVGTAAETVFGKGGGVSADTGIGAGVDAGAEVRLGVGGGAGIGVNIGVSTGVGAGSGACVTACSSMICKSLAPRRLSFQGNSRPGNPEPKTPMLRLNSSA